MKIFVTGGAGYLGSEVARQAVEAGHEVVATKLVHEPPHGRPLLLDLREPFDLGEVDVVIHTAYVQADPDMIVRSTANVVEAARRAGARMLHLSTDLVFDGESGAPYSEEDEPRPVSAYGHAKLEAERLADGLVVRTSLLYGKPEPGPQERLAAEGTEFYLDEIRCPTRVAELAAALLELAMSDVRGVLHVAGPEALSRVDFARRLGAVDPRGIPTPPGRARNVALDSARAATLLKTALSGVS